RGELVPPAERAASIDNLAGANELVRRSLLRCHRRIQVAGRHSHDLPLLLRIPARANGPEDFVDVGDIDIVIDNDDEPGVPPTIARGKHAIRHLARMARVTL